MNQPNHLDYLCIDKQLDEYQINSLNNRFKKDKTDRINKEFYATTALFSGTGNNSSSMSNNSHKIKA